MNIETLLREEIKSELEELKKIEVGTEEYKTAVDGIVKLVDRVQEMDKVYLDHQDVIDNREAEYEFKIKQMKSERNDKIVNHLIGLVGIGVPAVIAVWGTIASFEFEKEGVITTIMGRGWIQKLLLKK